MTCYYVVYVDGMRIPFRFEDTAEKYIASNGGYIVKEFV